MTYWTEYTPKPIFVQDALNEADYRLSRPTDLNRRPTVYKTVALPAELGRHYGWCRIRTYEGDAS